MREGPSLIGADNRVQNGRWLHDLTGSYLKALIVDACTVHLEHGLYGARRNETPGQRTDRLARRKSTAELVAEMRSFKGR